MYNSSLQATSELLSLSNSENQVESMCLWSIARIKLWRSYCHFLEVTPVFKRDYSKTATWSFIRTHLVEKEWGRWGPRRGESVERHNLEAFTLHPISGFFESYAQIWHLCKVMKLHLIKKRHLKQYNVIAQNIFSCCFRRLSEQRESNFLLLRSHSSMKSHST